MMFMSSMFTVSLLRKNARMIPSPTAASAAATATMKIAKTCPAALCNWYEKVAMLMFTAFSINSIDISTMMMLRRTITPTRPIAKSAADRTR
jgi:hypothetical protein